MCRNPLVRSHRPPGGLVSIAALLLAAALLVGTGPIRVRLRAGRAGTQPQRVNKARPQPDPLATASALDVFAVCLSAGMSVPAAASVTEPSAPAQLGSILRRSADLLALGADPDTAWTSETESPICQALLRLARRSAASGSALAAGVADLAEQARQEVVNTAVAAADRAGVLIAGPLGLCFLPSFVCLGIVPVVAGLAGDFVIAGL